MNAPANPFSIDFRGDASLGALLEAMAPHGGKPLVIAYGDRTIRPGYHVTEVKAGSFVTLDCGGTPDAWQETILQVEDLGLAGEHSFMAAGKFAAILNHVGKRIALASSARLTFEIGPPEAAMQIFDVDALHVGGGRLLLRLAPRPAICKPRHRAAPVEKASPCCAPRSEQGSSCCR